MNSENLEFLKTGLKYLGFDEKVAVEMEQRMAKGEDKFELRTQHGFGKDGKEKMDSTLSFRKSDNTDMYFFNRYFASATVNNEKLGQTFYIDKNKGFTVKEAFNMLHGRAVNKDLVTREGEKYNAWVKLKFDEKDDSNNYKLNKYHTEKYGIDMDAILGKYPIKELGDGDAREKLVASLQKGNLQAATFIKDGQDTRMFITVNPQFKSLDVYDSNMKKVRSNDVKQEQGIEGPAAGEQKAGKKNSPKKKDNNENGLLSKNRQGKRSGQHL